MPPSGKPRCWSRKRTRLQVADPRPEAQEKAYLRERARAIFGRAVEAADPSAALADKLASDPFPVPAAGGRTILIAIGKAAPAMLSQALTHVDGDCEAIAVTHYENEMDVPGGTVIRAAHPVPDENGVAAGERIIEILSTASSDDQVIALISGGGSALVPAPVEGVSLPEKAQVNRLLLGSGTDIVRMNLVRQQLSRLKGGGLLRHASPAPVTAYILSDVIGDDLRAVASGPTVSPIGMREDARRVCEEAGIWDDLPASVRAHMEAKEIDRAVIPPAQNHLIGSNRLSLMAACAEAEKDFEAKIISDCLTGDVAEAAEAIVQAARAKKSDASVALLFGGETTVQIRGDGLGGRNQELALRIAMLASEIGNERDWLFLSGGTDGRDGPTEAAGGFADAGTCDRIVAAGGDPAALLANNDSNRALALADDLLVTGATGTNVADIQVFLWGPAKGAP